MSFPHTKLLFPSSSSTLVLSGPHIQLVDSRTGALLATTTDRDGAAKDALIKSGPIRLAAVNKTGTYLVTSGDDKLLKLWQVEGLSLLNERELPKKPTGLAFTQDGQTILASDKFGDIFSYELHPAPQTVEQKKALASHDNPSGGKLILGHASFLTTFSLSFDEKYIITADRDEHIRVSWYPQGYSIETYCLGHEKFVSTIHVPAFSPTELVSGGGDPMLKVWDWMSGKLKRNVHISDVVEPFIKVKPAGKVPRRFEDDGEEGKQKLSKKAKARAKKQAEREVSTPAAPEENTEELEHVVEEPEAILALLRIESLKVDDARYLVFSAVGATALFLCPFPDSDDAASAIQTFDFGKPVLEFTLSADGLIWVCLDGQWTDSGSLEDTPTMVRVLRVSSGAFVEVSDESTVSLLSTLNSKCILPATRAELKTLDIYLPLLALPKNNETEHDPMDRDPMLQEAEEEGGGGLSRKELGRLKSKKAVAKAQKRGPGGEDEEEGRSTKKSRSEDGTDVVMDEA
ncbi:WD40 repeat-like protein [Roridomyces roridus]|uniref:WD40 repeat-like protein n=1 Tax=Roridomyces roridus TaxID=1738132 RepID=A0AAD7FHZ6_9AGAR|nr:WD40 repeat-like protein [Roridomyces roridus]